MNFFFFEFVNFESIVTLILSSIVNSTMNSLLYFSRVPVSVNFSYVDRL